MVRLLRDRDFCYGRHHGHRSLGWPKDSPTVVQVFDGRWTCENLGMELLIRIRKEPWHGIGCEPFIETLFTFGKQLVSEVSRCIVSAN